MRRPFRFDCDGWIWEWDGTGQTAPRRVEPSPVKASVGSRWATLRDAAILSGFDIEAIRLAYRNGYIRGRGVAINPSVTAVIVVYEDVLAWGEQCTAIRSKFAIEGTNARPLYGLNPDPDELGAKVRAGGFRATQKKKHKRGHRKRKRARSRLAKG